MTPNQSQFPKATPRPDRDQVARVIQGDKNHKLNSAKEAMKQKLMRAVMQQALEDMGNPDEVAGQIMEQFGTGHDAVRYATASLRDMMVDEIARRAAASLSEPAKAARLAQSRIGADHSVFKSASSALRDVVLDEVARRTLSMLTDGPAAAQDAKGRINYDDPAVTGAVARVRDVLLDDVVARSIDSLTNLKEISRLAKNRVNNDHEAIKNAAEMTRDLLVSHIAEHAANTLGDPSTVAHQAKSKVRSDHESLVAASGVLRELLIEEVVRRTTEGMQDLGTVARQAKHRVGGDHEVVAGAINVLREELFDEIARRTTSSIADVNQTAVTAKARIGDNHMAIINVSDALRELLIGAIARRALESLASAQLSAEEAFKRVEDDDPKMVNVHRALQERMVQRMMSDAIEEINDAVDTSQEEGPDFFSEAPESVVEAPVASTPEQFQVAPSSFVEEPHPVAPTAEAPATVALQEPAFDASANTTEAEAPEAQSPEAQTAESEAFFTEAVGPNQDYAHEVVEAADLSFDVEEETFVFEPDDEAVFTEVIEPFEEEHQFLFEEEQDDDTFALTTFEEEGDDSQPWTRLSDFEGQEEASAQREAQEEAVKFYESEVRSSRQPELMENITWEEEAAFEEEPAFEDEGNTSVDDPLEPVRLTPAAEETVEETAPAPFVSPASSAAETCFYVYGIMGSDAAESVEEFPEAGIDENHDVYLVKHKAVSAIVSHVSGDQFGPDTLPTNLRDGDWVKAHVRAHAGVLEQFKGAGTLVPLRFGSVYNSEAEVTAILQQRYEIYLDALKRLAGKEEWGLRIYRDNDRMREKVEESNRKVEDSLGAISKGVARFVKDEMEKMGTAAENDATELVTANCIKRCHDVLQSHAHDAVFKALVSGGPAVKGEMIVNVAYLVAENHGDAFKKSVAGLAEKYADLGFNFEMTGPWPPYHFVEKEG